jgi:NADH-quinone oxidoreductase subunit C
LNPEELAAALRPRFDDVFVARGEVTAMVEREAIREALSWLRSQPGLELDFLSSLTATDHPGRSPRFWLSYEMRSMARLHRVRVKAGVPGDDVRAPSVSDLFPTANWHERECFDFFGIVFDGHPNLTRILMPDDWEGYPLRKDEELGGVPTWFHGATVPPVDKRGMA